MTQLSALKTVRGRECCTVEIKTGKGTNKKSRSQMDSKYYTTYILILHHVM